MDHEALAELPGRLALLMQHLVGEALARRCDRSDLVQETMLRVLASSVTEARAAEGPDALWAHARTMARRVVVDASRSARQEPRRMSSLVPQGKGAVRAGDSRGPLDWTKVQPGPSTQAATAESAEAWLNAYRSLSPEHRRVLGLRRFEGLSAAEAGARMGRSESAVHSLFRRALGAWEAAASGRLAQGRGAAPPGR